MVRTFKTGKMKVADFFKWYRDNNVCIIGWEASQEIVPTSGNHRNSNSCNFYFEHESIPYIQGFSIDYVTNPTEEQKNLQYIPAFLDSKVAHSFSKSKCINYDPYSWFWACMHDWNYGEKYDCFTFALIQQSNIFDMEKLTNQLVYKQAAFNPLAIFAISFKRMFYDYNYFRITIILALGLWITLCNNLGNLLGKLFVPSLFFWWFLSSTSYYFYLKFGIFTNKSNIDYIYFGNEEIKLKFNSCDQRGFFSIYG